MTTNKIFAAVGDDGTRPVVWGLGDSLEAALQDCESQGAAQSCAVHEITVEQAAIVRSGDVSWPIVVPVAVRDGDLYPTYSIRADLDADVARWLGEQQGDGPLSLIDVTDVCATHQVSATLRNAQGSVVGHVAADGNYRLG